MPPEGIGYPTIRKQGEKFLLISTDGKVLGTHNTRAAATEQESAVNISKARETGRRITPPKMKTVNHSDRGRTKKK
jgi:hypothetical protein